MKVVPKPNAKGPGGWLEPNESLTVLAISAVATEGAKYLIWSRKQNSAALFSGFDFEIVDASLSPRWVAGLDANGFIYLAPRDWQTIGFWERYYDGEAGAAQIFEREMKAILSV